MYLNSLASPLAAVFGPARSGTTWLGAMLNAHPDIAYRFEPFSRLIRKNNDVRDLQDELIALGESDQETSSTELVGRVRSLVNPASPLVDKPPFHGYGDFHRRIRTMIWYAGRALPVLGKLQEKLYPASAGQTLLFKEVDRDGIAAGLLKLSVPIAYLVRHPVPCVSSLLKGQRENKMPSIRISMWQDIVASHDAGLVQKFAREIGDDTVMINAMLWRAGLETAFRSIAHDKLHSVTYEELCDDPSRHVEQILNHYGLSMCPEVDEFIDQLANIDGDKDNQGYFSVFRDPKATKEIWKSTVSNEQRDKILHVVQDSEAYQYFAARGGW